MLAFGVRNVPVVARGDQFVFGQNLEDVAEFVGLQGTGHTPVPPEQLIGKWLIVLEALQRYIRQFPEARIAALRRANGFDECASLHDGETVVPTAVSDTTLLPSNRDWDARHASGGTDAQLGVGRHPHQHADLRTLMRFDLSGVSKGTEILAARLRLAFLHFVLQS